jgi:hypothetical protein
MLDIADECDGCSIVTRDLTPHGWRELCPTCFRLAIEGLELPREERPPQSARDSTLWEP